MAVFGAFFGAPGSALPLTPCAHYFVPFVFVFSPAVVCVVFFSLVVWLSCASADRVGRAASTRWGRAQAQLGYVLGCLANACLWWCFAPFFVETPCGVGLGDVFPQGLWGYVLGSVKVMLCLLLFGADFPHGPIAPKTGELPVAP